MRTITSIWILLFLMSCSTIQKPMTKSSYYVEKDFQHDLESFIVDADRYGARINLSGFKIIKVDLAEFGVDRLAGYCDIKSKTILIFQKFYDKYPPSKRKFLLYHELGHCLLLRKHTWDRAENYPTCPRSVMHPQEGDYCFDMLEEQYIHELFTNPEKDEIAIKGDFR
jgi:hypothetical protein